MQIFGKSDVGLCREQNQDSMFFSSEPIGKVPNLFLVADGMGGHNAGDFASQYTKEKIIECIENSIYENPLLILNDAIRNANRMLYEKSLEDEGKRGMGTTLTLGFLAVDRVHIFQIGDSRLYHITKDSIRQVTEDHSYVEEMIKRGLMEKGSVEYWKNKNVITRAIGTHEMVLADVFEEHVIAGDILLLCSDGLTNLVDDGTILRVLQMDDTLEESADKLIQLANDNGGQDNITVVLVRIE